MKKSQQEALELDVYLEPMIEVSGLAVGPTPEEQQVIICVSNCGPPPPPRDTLA